MNYKNKKRIAVTLCASMLFAFTGCNNPSTPQNTGSETTSSQELNSTDMFSDRDLRNEPDLTSATTISLSNQSVTIDKEGTYIITGSIDNGQIIIDAADTDKVQLVLNNVNITSTDSAAIFVKEADKVFITSAAGTTNTLASTGEYAENEYNIDATIFSKSDLTLNGTGYLSVTSATGHGIVSKDDLVFGAGNYTVTCAKTAVSANDSVRVAGGTFNITCETDGFHSENTEDTEKGFIYIENGDFNITCGSDGFDSTSTLEINNGNFTIDAQDDAMHSDNHLWIKDGYVNVTNSYEGLESMVITIDNGNINIISSDDGLNATSGSTSSESDIQQPDNMGNMSEMPSMPNDMANMSEPPSMPNDMANMSEPPSMPNDMANMSEPPSMPNDMANMSEPPSMPNDMANMSEPPSMRGNRGGNQMGMGANPFESDNNCQIIINGGTITINANGDGIDTNGTLTVTGGTTYIYGPENSGNGAMDYASTADISGGTVIAVGYSGMALNFSSSSTQGSMMVNLSSTYSANDAIILKDSNGNEIINVISPKSYNSVVISSPDITTGNTYTLTTGSDSTTVEMTSTIYSNGGGMGGMGGFDNRKQNRPF